MAKETGLTIKDFQVGIGASPHTGFADMRNLDILTRPGVARLNNATTKQSSTTVTDLIKWQWRNPRSTGDFWALGDTQKVYKGTSNGTSWSVISGNTTSGGPVGQGGVIYKDYLFVCRSTAIDVFGPLSGATVTVTIASPAVFTKTAHGLSAGDPIIFSTTGALPTGLTAGTVYYVIAAGLMADAFEVSTSVGGAAVNTSGSQSGTHTYSAWENGWQTIDADTEFHPMIVGQDDYVYGGAGRYVFSIKETSGSTFDPNSSSTYTFTSRALDLPANYRIKCLAEQGKELAIGTWMGSNIYEFKVADIFYWDRVSDTFRLPIQLSEHGVNALWSKNGLLYILAGIEGKVYVSNSVQASFIAQIPQSVTGIGDGTYIVPYPGAITDYKGRVTFGISTSPGGTAPGMGVWSIVQGSKSAILNHEHTISTGSDGTSNQLLIGSLISVSQNSLLIGWRDNSTYGIDMVDTTKYTSYAGYFDSPLYQVGSSQAKSTFSNVEFQLDKPLTTGQGIRIKYRKNLSDAFTTIGTWDFATNGAISSVSAGASISNAEFLQIRCEMTTGVLNTTPELRYLRFT